MEKCSKGKKQQRNCRGLFSRVLFLAVLPSVSVNAYSHTMFPLDFLLWSKHSIQCVLRVMCVCFIVRCLLARRLLSPSCVRAPTLHPTLYSLCILTRVSCFFPVSVSWFVYFLQPFRVRFPDRYLTFPSNVCGAHLWAKVKQAWRSRGGIPWFSVFVSSQAYGPIEHRGIRR